MGKGAKKVWTQRQVGKYGTACFLLSVRSVTLTFFLFHHTADWRSAEGGRGCKCCRGREDRKESGGGRVGQGHSGEAEVGWEEGGSGG